MDLEMLYEEEDIVYDGYQARQLVRFPASHHSSPLTYYPQRHVISVLKGDAAVKQTPLLKLLAEKVIILNKRLGGGFKITDDPTKVYSMFLKLSCRDGVGDSKLESMRRTVEMCLTVSTAEVQSDLQVLNVSHPGLENSLTAGNLTADKISNICTRLEKCFFARDILERIRTTVQQCHIQNDERLKEIENCDNVAVFNAKDIIFFAFQDECRMIVIINYDQLLMLFDTISCRCMTRLSIELNMQLKTDNLPEWPILRSIYEWGDDMLTQYGVKAYAVIGEFESIVTGIFVTFRDSDPLGLGQDFVTSIEESAAEIETELGIPRQETRKLLNILRDIESVNHLSEIFGIRKHWGNPMVEAKDSGRAVQEKVDEELPIDGSALIRLLASFNRMIIMEFIIQHGKWPEGSFPEDMVDCPIKRAFDAKVTRIVEHSEDHRHEHWSCFKFKPNCLIDSYYNDLSIVTDKSVSVYRSHLDAVYVRALCKYPVPNFSENRRLILEYIRKQHMPILDIFKIVMTRSIPEEWLANCSAMKGTEMKYLKARIFAVLTYEIRQYFAATEDIIKEHLFRYNPHQTMTLAEHELLARLRSVTRQLDPNSESRYLAVMHIVDFSKWNLRMRYSNTCLVFKSIDDFLGTPGLIESSHGIFSDMVNLVQDPFNPPDQPVSETESDTIWRNHNCGWEGQRQKGWTVLTSAVLADLARVTGVHSTICGQGDNQTLLTQFPVPDRYKNPYEWIAQDPHSVKNTLDQFYQKLESECLSVGLKIKTAETCRSLSYFNYGKRLYFNGVELSMTLKRISKTVTEPNDSYPTSESLLKTMESSTFAAGLYSHPSMLPYLISRFLVAFQLYSSFTNNPLTQNKGKEYLESKNMRLSPRFLAILMKVPASLGGPPQLSLAAHLYRGHPDPLCTDLVMPVLRARQGCETSKQMLACARSGIWFNQDRIEKNSLIAAPYSLNLNIPISCRIPIENEVLPALRARCQNPMIKEMFSTGMDALDRDLTEALKSMNPFQPLVANDIYARSPPGQRKSFLKGLSNTTSLGRLVYEIASRPMVLRIQNLELEQLKSWAGRVLDVLNLPPVEFEDVPHHELANELRTKSWQCQLVGTTVPHPLEQFKLGLSHHDRCTIQCNDCEPEHVIMVQHSEDIISVPGVDSTHISTMRSRTGSPYLGNQITEGIIQKEVKCVNPDSTWRDVIRLNTLRKWICAENSNLNSVLLDLIRSRTDVPQDIIDKATGIPSRLSYNHRAALMSVINSCGVSSTTNMHSRLYISSNRMGDYSHGEFNYHMPFGPVYLCFQELVCLKGIMNPASWTESIRSIYHIHVRTKSVPKVYDGLMDTAICLSSSTSLRKMPKVLFSDYNMLEFETQSGFVADALWGDWEKAPIVHVRYGYCYQLISNSFVIETVIRESISLDHFGSFPPRSSPISIGDINLVGVTCLVKALAWNFLLLSPLSVWACFHVSSFSIRAHSFVDSFSKMFWLTFLEPLSNSRLSNRLFRLAEAASSFQSTKTSAGLIGVLKTAVISSMWDIHESFKLSILHQGTVSPLPLYAPSASSLRLMFSKYVEYTVFVGVLSVHGDRRDAFDYSRDFSNNVLCIPTEMMASMIRRIICDLRELITTLRCDQIVLPAIQFYSMQHPWIDRLRQMTYSAPPLENENEIPYPNGYPVCDLSALFTIPVSPVYVDREPCACPSPERSYFLHSECFFARSGLLSKSHMKFLDLIFSFNLDVEGVIVVGSSTGTDAFGIAKIDECKHVYVNCFMTMSEFSPHMAGSYVPPAFLSGGLEHKLVMPSSAAVSSSDLLQEETISAILTHLEGYLFSGLICDAEFPSITSSLPIISLLRNLNKLVVRRTYVDWCIVKVPFRCRHDVEDFVTVIGQVFMNVDVCSSPFTRPGANLLYLVGTVRRERPLPDVARNTVMSVVIENTNLDSIIEEIKIDQICRLFRTQRQVTMSRLQVCCFGKNSLARACQTYIPGWKPVVSHTISRAELIAIMRDAIKVLKSHAMETLKTSYRLHGELRMPRASILQLNMGPLHKKLNKTFLNVSKCELLLKLLKDDVLLMSKVVTQIVDWMQSPHRYQMLNRCFDVDLDVSSFINHDSRYLFEILGHVYGNDFSLGISYTPTSLYHKIPKQMISQTLNHPIVPLLSSHHYPTPNLTWHWKRRSKILFWLLAAYLEEKPVTIMSSMSSLLDEFHDSNRLADLLTGTNPGDVPVVIEIHDLCHLLEVVEAEFTKAFLLISVSLCPVLHQFLVVENFFKCPWTGLIPDKVICVCTHGRVETINQTPYPDFSMITNSINVIGDRFIGCRCWDCAVEQLLVEKHRLSHNELDKICSLRKIETVRDLLHIL